MGSPFQTELRNRELQEEDYDRNDGQRNRPTAIGGQGAPPLTHGQAGQRHRHHGYGNEGNSKQLDVVQLQTRIGMAREQPTVLNHETRIVDRLADGHPTLLPCRRNPEECGQAKSQHGGGDRAQHRNPRFRQQGHDQRDSREQVTEHYAQGGVRQPCARDHQGQQQRVSIHSIPRHMASLRLSVAQDQHQHERNPESAGHLRKSGALVGSEQRVAGEDRQAPGQRGPSSNASRASARVARPVPASSRNQGRGKPMPGQQDPSGAPSIHVSGG